MSYWAPVLITKLNLFNERNLASFWTFCLSLCLSAFYAQYEEHFRQICPYLVLCINIQIVTAWTGTTLIFHWINLQKLHQYKHVNDHFLPVLFLGWLFILLAAVSHTLLNLMQSSHWMPISTKQKYVWSCNVLTILVAVVHLPTRLLACFSFCFSFWAALNSDFSRVSFCMPGLQRRLNLFYRQFFSSFVFIMEVKKRLKHKYLSCCGSLFHLHTCTFMISFYICICICSSSWGLMYDTMNWTHIATNSKYTQALQGYLHIHFDP